MAKDLLAVVGFVCLLVGVAMIYLPAALIVAGLALMYVAYVMHELEKNNNATD